MSRKRLDELARMDDGWYWDDRGKAPTTRAIAIARSFDACFAGARIFPTIEGGVSLEGDANSIAWDIRIGPRGGVKAYATDLSPYLSASRSAT